MAFNTINAKAEIVTTSPANREPKKRRRCLVPADWFYEWKKLDEKTKQHVPPGSIPACAGVPAPTLRTTSMTRVYPRVCGGTALAGSLIAKLLQRLYPPQCHQRQKQKDAVDAIKSIGKLIHLRRVAQQSDRQ
jgi:hypothetical protein